MTLSSNRLYLRLAGVFRTSRAIRTNKETIWVKITQGKLTGWGEAVPMDTYRQTLESAEACLALIGHEFGESPFDLERSLSRLLVKFPNESATIAAIDAALHDWVGKTLGTPIVRLLGLNPEDAPRTSFSIGIGAPEEVADLVRSKASYPIFKLKLGSLEDEKTLAKVRESAPQAVLRVDANMAWTVEHALVMLPILERYGVELLEQPLPAAELDGLSVLKERRVLPIVADESCVNPTDVLKVAPFVDGINIKLSKCGGIRQGLKMIHIARAAGLKVMLGCMIESSLGISAAAQLSPLADWLDLDGHLLLAKDPFTGLGGEGGRLTPGAGPGLGVREATS